MNAHTKFEVRSFTRSWDNNGCLETLGSPWIRPLSLFSIISKWAFVRTSEGDPLRLWMLRLNLKSVALPIPEIMGGGIKNFRQSLDTPFKFIRCHWFWYQSKARNSSPLGQNLVSDNFDKIHFFAEMDSWHDDTCPIKTRSCFAQPKWLYLTVHKPRISVDQ